MPTQLPQVAPQPVRMVSSDMVRQPASAASRIWRSVTPLHRQTYTRGSQRVYRLAVSRQMRMSVNSGHSGRGWSPTACHRRELTARGTHRRSSGRRYPGFTGIGGGSQGTQERRHADRHDSPHRLPRDRCRPTKKPRRSCANPDGRRTARRPCGRVHGSGCLLLDQHPAPANGCRGVGLTGWIPISGSGGQPDAARAPSHLLRASSVPVIQSCRRRTAAIGRPSNARSGRGRWPCKRGSGPGCGTASAPAICRANGARWRSALL